MKKWNDLPRSKKEQFVYSRTHKDFKGITSGEKCVLVCRKGATVSRPVTELTDDEVNFYEVFHNKKYISLYKGDLFECLQQLPPVLRNTLSECESDDNTYKMCANLLEQVEALGFTFDYGLDAIPHNLRLMVGENT